MRRLTKAGPKLLAAALTTLAARDAYCATQYDMHVLGVLGQANGVDAGVVVGYNQNGAGYWTDDGAAFTPLPTPPGFRAAAPVAVFGDQFLGDGYLSGGNQEQVVMWTGPDHTLVNLSGGPGRIAHPTATDGVQQVGVTSGPGAGLWSGTAASFVPLNPPGYSSSVGTGVWAGIQVGYGSAPGSSTQALAWHGTAASFSVLRNQSEGLGVSRGQAVGFTDLATRGGSLRDAAVWNNVTASGFVDLSPAGTTASELMSTNGTQQVGDVSLLAPNPGLLPFDHNPAVWTGNASSYHLLPMPQGDNYGFASSIDGDGNIAGYAQQFNFQTGTFSGTVPVLWVPHRLPGDANFDGKVGFSDVLILAQHYGQPGEWVDGEFGGGGTVDFADLLTLAQHYGQSQPAVEYSLATSVPEPSCYAIVILVLPLLRSRRG